MKLYIDRKNRRFVKSVASNVALDRLVLKRRDAVTIEVVFVENGAVVATPSGTAITTAIKRDFSDANFLALADNGTLTLNTVPLEAAFATGPASIPAYLEVRWTASGEATRTATLAADIQNSVIIGTEGTPAAIPDGKATQAQAEAGTDNTTWMTPLRVKQAIATSPVGGASSWDALTGKPSTFPPATHTHTASQITDFTAAVVAAAPPTTNASLLTSGTLPDARLSAGVATSLGKADSALQSSALTPYRTASAQDTIDAGKATSAQGAKADSALQSGAAISNISGLQTALDGKQASGSYATLVGGLVPSSQLPSYVDDVLEFATLAAFPATGETGKIYVPTGTNKVYRWSGSAYVEIVAAPGSTDAVPEGSANLYFTAARAVSALASTLTSYATTTALNSAISGLSSVYTTTAAVATQITAYGYQTAAQVSSAISTALASYATTASLAPGTVANALVRAIGTSNNAIQGSDIVIDDATTSTTNNVAITNQHVGQTNSALVLTPKGTGAFILGPKPDGTVTGGNARGVGAVDLQPSRTAASQVASGANSFAVGSNNTVTNSNGVAMGLNNSVAGGSFPSAAIGSSCIANATSAFAFGRSSSAGNYAFAVGGFCNASGDGSCSAGNSAISSGQNSQAFGESVTSSAIHSSAFGNFGVSNRRGMFSHCSGTFSGTVTGDAQRARFVLRCKTTTNTAVEMALDGGTTYLGIPSGKIIACTINISGVSSTGAAVAHYVRQYAVKNVAGTSSQVYAPVTTGADNAAGTVINLSANDTDDTLRISVTGIASQTWRWVASVDAVEIAYGA
jgi:hypothetical protein